MTDNDTQGFSLSVNAQRSTREAIIYWIIVGAITVPVMFLVIGLLVRWALGG